jgi:hypothetical protein
VEPWTSEHGEPEKDPETPLSEKLTVPPGVSAEPEVELSFTVAVQVEDWLTTTGVVQETVVVVLRGLIVIPDALLELSACAVSVVAGA